MYENIKVEKINVLRKDKDKMVPSILDVYDIYDNRTMKTIFEKDSVRDNNKLYSKKKVEIIPKQNIKFYKYLIRKTIDQLNLFGEENNLSVEYLTTTGWKSNGEARGKSEYRSIMATPTIDKNVPSGNYNNAIDDNEPILMVRINVFNN